jgi:hypothetical protein
MKGGTQCFDSNWDDFSGKIISEFLKGGFDDLYTAVPTSVFRDTGKSKFHHRK